MRIPFPLFLKRWSIGVVSFMLNFSIRSTVYGDARWMNDDERKVFFHKNNKGLVLGDYQLSLKNSYKNLVIFGKSGGGKTTEYIIPNLLNCSGSMVVTDPSGEIFRDTSGYLKKKGYKINVLRLADPLNSSHFNYMFLCDTTQKLRQLATTLAKRVDDDDSSIWITGATDILCIGLVALSRCGNPDFQTLGNLRWFINHIGTDGKAVKNFGSLGSPVVGHKM